MLSLSNNITGKSFEGYVSACFCHADAFSLTQNGWKNTQKKMNLTRFCSFLHRIISAHCTQTAGFVIAFQTDMILKFIYLTPSARPEILFWKSTAACFMITLSGINQKIYAFFKMAY